MKVERIRTDLGERVFELACECSPESILLVNLLKESPCYNPQTGVSRCLRCGEELHRDAILAEETKVREHWQAQNEDTGEAINE
ncbi:MAG: hypothetical protein WC329_02960 [Candidatus Omnitrophota bacterium]|jgi:hypothetical protein